MPADHALPTAETIPLMYPYDPDAEPGVPFTVNGMASEDRGDGIHIVHVPIAHVAVLVGSHGLVPAQLLNEPEDAPEPAPRRSHHRRVEPDQIPPADKTDFKRAKDPEGTAHPSVPSDKEWDGLTR